MNAEVLLFDGFEELDAIGPYETLCIAADRGADLAVETVVWRDDTREERTAMEIEAAHGLTVTPDGELGDPDLLVVPGGGWSGGGGVRREVEGDLPGVIADRHREGSIVASVCTGAMLLAAGGLLDGRPATTHHGAHEDLAGGARRIDARVVDDGDVLTAGGITSGLDLALHLVDREFGIELAETVADELEYERQGEVHRNR